MGLDFQHLGALSPSGTIVIAALIIIIFAAYHTLWAHRRGMPPLPPGPPPEPLLGHYRIVPQDAAFKRYAEWAKEYGTISTDLFRCGRLD